MNGMYSGMSTYVPGVEKTVVVPKKQDHRINVAFYI